MFGNTKTGEVKEVNYRGAFLMHNILLFKATESASGLTQHRISPAFFFFFITLIKHCLLKMIADGRGTWGPDVKLTGISELSALVYGGFAVSSLRRQKANTFSNMQHQI